MSDSVDSPKLQVRKMRLQVGADVPRHWHGGRRAVTLFFDNLSVFFPAGERFFIASVRAHLKQVEDEALKRDAAAFCAQEGIHSREHTRFNRWLAERGYPIAALERRVEALLERTARHTPPRRQLAVTCALEHFTALMGHIVLSNPRVLEGAHPEIARLWHWHAIEETEHKAVAFDVYRAAGGPYLERVLAMSMTTVSFWSRVILQQAALMRADRCLFSLGEWRALLRFLFIEPGGMFGLWRRWLDYYNRRLLEARLAELGPLDPA
jgi:predicted metal-dependent hydrolase